MSSTPNPSWRTESSTSSRWPGKPGVDEQDAVAVGDEGPVHQVGLREVDGVGDGRQWTEVATRQSGGRETEIRTKSSGNVSVQSRAWRNMPGAEE